MERMKQRMKSRLMGLAAGRRPAWAQLRSPQADLAAERPCGPNSFSGYRRQVPEQLRPWSKPAQRGKNL